MPNAPAKLGFKAAVVGFLVVLTLLMLCFIAAFHHTALAWGAAAPSTADAAAARQGPPALPDQRPDAAAEAGLLGLEGPPAPLRPGAFAAWIFRGRTASRFPPFIHQTVKDKSRLSCQQRDAMQSWTTLNPGYKLVLWDDGDVRALVKTHYPHLLSHFESLVLPVERADWFRYLVIHKYGGVYADLDVRCMRPIAQWNREHGHDAEVLVGTEFDADTHDSLPPKQFEQWALVGAPGHPLMLSAIQVSILKVAELDELAKRRTGGRSGQDREEDVQQRTGPMMWTDAVYIYLEAQGFIAGGVRLMPLEAFGLGWDIVKARSNGKDVSCRSLPEARQMLVCHEFWGTWKSFYSYRLHQVHDDCRAPVPKLTHPLELDPGLRGDSATAPAAALPAGANATKRNSPV